MNATLNLTAQTPREIDTRIAELETELWKERGRLVTAIDSAHRQVRDRKVGRGQWKMNDADAEAKLRALVETETLPFVVRDINATIAKLDTARAKIEEWKERIAPLDAEYKRRPWSRFFQLRSTRDARIHDGSWCQGLHRSDYSDLGWHPELSGLTRAEAVDALGPVMCSKCFPGAPVEWRRNPKDLRVDPDRCPGAEQDPKAGTVKLSPTSRNFAKIGVCTGCGEMQTVRNDGKVGIHKKQKAPKGGTFTGPDGNPVRTTRGIIGSERTAQIDYTDNAAYLAACQAGYPGRGRVAEAASDAGILLAALAHHRGTTVEAQRELLAARVAKKARTYQR